LGVFGGKSKADTGEEFWLASDAHIDAKQGSGSGSFGVLFVASGTRYVDFG
jgi:hypothetical protein